MVQQRRPAMARFGLVNVSSLLLITCSVWLAVGVGAQSEDLNYRLPNNTYPLKYNIELTTRVHDDTIGPERFRFDGKVTIQLRTTADPAGPSDAITLNYRQISISHVKLWAPSPDGWDNVLVDDGESFALDPDREFLTVRSPQPLNGTYFLEVKYNGTLREDNGGFYRSSYQDDAGNVRWLATTQFSSTDARHAFPCYDEPGIRAPIGLRVIHGKSYSVLSTGVPIDVRDSLLEGMAMTTFTETPVMQSYLLGIIVSDFKPASLAQFPRQQAYARPTALYKDNANFMIEAGFKTLQALEAFLETPYILPKLYHVAVPDFAPGAMENYGLITYKEENFLYDPETSPMKQQKKIATIVGHEVGHHYFGNYVSPAWWSFLWMKEGFARFFEYTISHMVFPELEIGDTYTIDKTHNAFAIDSLGSARPMTYYVNTQTEIRNVFDDIAYDKGGAVLLMFYHAIGQETFRQALVNYLHANALKAASPEQFAEAMQIAISNAGNVLPFSALALLKSWTEQAGYPIVHVSRSTPDCSLRIHQERYLLKGTDRNGSSVSWLVPVNFATKSQPSFEGTTADGWLTEASLVITPTPERNWSCDEWVVLNKQQTGYYRVNYDRDLWMLIVEALRQNGTVFHTVNRAQLIDDALNNARSGRLDYDVPLELLRYLSQDDHYVPWAAVDRNLALLNVLLSGTDTYGLWHRYLLEFVEPTFARMGMATRPRDTLPQRMARELVVKWACLAGSPECLNATASIVEDIAENRLPDADPDLREPILCNGLRRASAGAFSAIWQRMQVSQDQAYRSELIRSLGCVEDELLIEQFLNTTIDPSGSNYFGQERERVLMAVYRNGMLGMKMAIKFFELHMDLINELYNKGNFGGRAISSAMRNMAQQVSSEEMHVQLQGLMEQLLEKGLLRSSDMLQALEYSSENLMWIQTRGIQIERWLNEQYPPPTEPPTTTTVTTTTTTTVRVTETTRRTTTYRPTRTTVSSSASSTALEPSTSALTSSSTEWHANESTPVVTTVTSDEDDDDDTGGVNHAVGSAYTMVLVTLIHTILVFVK